MTKRHPTFYFDETPVVIQVESTLFKVHKYHLLESETFRDMSQILQSPSEETEEVTTTKHPLVLNSVTASEFEALLTMLYARRCSSVQSTLTPSMITSAYQLAHMWNFTDLQRYLLVQAEESLDDFEKIRFAKQFDVQGWLVPTYLNVCRRPTPPTTGEAARLGIDDLVMLFRLREEYRPWDPIGGSNPDLDDSNIYCGNCVGHSYLSSDVNPPNTTTDSIFTFYSSSPKCAKCGNQTRDHFKWSRPSGSNRPNRSLEDRIEQWVKGGCAPE
ncbi:unnamed protein product [Rhizoctonia solani]|uniref:BTB domain-containing protein n=1 Tax=Rhizoctonia solani TaxID=456999 RepID=A0A8H3GW93_9AGAM|nr:unnamed protein product [Rhizoctonia solani]